LLSAGCLTRTGTSIQFIASTGQPGHRLVGTAAEVTPVSGVQRISREGELRGPYDVVLASHILEHHAEPARLLAKLRALTAPGGLVYLEVPWESPWLVVPHLGSALRPGGQRSESSSVSATRKSR